MNTLLVIGTVQLTVLGVLVALRRAKALKEDWRNTSPDDALLALRLTYEAERPVKGDYHAFDALELKAADSNHLYYEVAE